MAAGAIAAARRSEALRVRLAGRLDDPARRCSWWPSSPRSPSVLRWAAWPPRTSASSTSRPSRTRSPIRCSSPLARWDAVWYLRIADSGYGGSRRARGVLPALPAARARRWRRRSAAPRPPCWSPRTWWRWPRSWRALVLLHRLVALELGRPLARPDAAAAGRVPGRAVLRRALRREPVPGCWRWARSTPARTGRWAWAGACLAGAAATRSAGVLLLRAAGDRSGGAPAAALGARTLAWLALGPLGLVRVRALPRPGRGRRAALPRRPGGLVARAAVPLAGRLGRRRGGVGRAAPARLGSDARSSTSSRRPAIRTGSPRST